MTTETPVDKLAKVWRKIKEARKELQANFDEEDGKLKEQQAVIESKLLAHCKELGAEGIKTRYGTVTRRVQTRYWFADWEAANQFILDHGALHLLERRVAQRAIEAWLTNNEGNPDMLPPSLQTDSKFVISVTAPRTKAD